MSDWKRYARLGEIEARPWTEADRDEWALALKDQNTWREYDKRISVSSADAMTARDAVGFVARNPANHSDQWYIAPDYFAKHYAEQSDLEKARAEQAGLIRDVKHYLESAEKFKAERDSLRASLAAMEGERNEAVSTMTSYYDRIQKLEEENRALMFEADDYFTRWAALSGETHGK